METINVMLCPHFRICCFSINIKVSLAEVLQAFASFAALFVIYFTCADGLIRKKMENPTNLDAAQILRKRRLDVLKRLEKSNYIQTARCKTVGI